MNTRLSLLVAVSALALATMACDPTTQPVKLVDGVCFETYSPPGQGGTADPWGRVTVKWSANSIVAFGAGEIPMIARFDGEYKQFGQVRTIYNPIRKASDMYVEFDVATVTKQNAQRGGDLMPNGLPVPVGFGNEDMFKLPLNNPNKPPKDYIHFAASQSSLNMGVTFQVPSLDKVYKNIPAPLSLFIPLVDQQTNQTLFAAGMYTSPTAGLNGVGVFMDASPLTHPITDVICRGQAPSGGTTPLN